MDPIKVDFTGGGADKGPDKKTGVVIPPERKVNKTHETYCSNRFL